MPRRNSHTAISTELSRYCLNWRSLFLLPWVQGNYWLVKLITLLCPNWICSNLTMQWCHFLISSPFCLTLQILQDLVSVNIHDHCLPSCGRVYFHFSSGIIKECIWNSDYCQETIILGSWIIIDFVYQCYSGRQVVETEDLPKLCGRVCWTRLGASQDLSMKRREAIRSDLNSPFRQLPVLPTVPIHKHAVWGRPSQDYKRHLWNQLRCSKTEPIQREQQVWQQERLF